VKSWQRIAVGLALAAAPVALGGAPAVHAASSTACLVASGVSFSPPSQGVLVNTSYLREDPTNGSTPFCYEVDAWGGIPAHVVSSDYTGTPGPDGGGIASGPCMAVSLSSSTAWNGGSALLLGGQVLLADAVAATPTAFEYSLAEVNTDDLVWSSNRVPQVPCIDLSSFNGAGVDVATG